MARTLVITKRPLRSDTIATVLGLLLLAGAICDGTASSVYVPVPADRVNQAEKTRVEYLATDLLNTWREGKFKALSNDFSLQMSAGLPPGDQEKAYESLRALFGDFRALRFVETVTSPAMPGYVYYRFRGKFSSTTSDPEIRVLVDGDGKIAGFWVRHWLDEVR